MGDTLRETDLRDMGVPKRGKVRDVYDLGDRLLIVATDRLSAFDVVLPTPIPDKGRVLTKLSIFWFKQMEDIIENHLIETEVERFPGPLKNYALILKDRSMLVKKTKVIPVECVVRGYLAGSGWNDYRQTGSICGIKLPPGLLESEKLPAPIFTPTTKAEEGHDMAITEEQLIEITGEKLARQLKDLSIAIYNRACSIAEKKGIIIADTKFEFGMIDGRVILIDEILTPDSSRFWSMKDYRPGKSQDSYDKQIVRDYLNTLDWDKKYPGPELPKDIVDKTARRYREILEILTG
ncbi:MAG TPA: phosphoribosylaminoimidazolesuccinocarboxamide synthase [Syntrophorhabdaceae bacterium]|nr:phosphoribosylaminoimidazolesuccinocarboxamide synthase [Syntrophorhabdaceae bacterium]HQE80375.1 phosphoribosylaminoimidazolesuccinocarboxamide synthase [Syntrophorhabdaceae bacterium]HQH43857.1 phosphoribosylaminoimidazolesuccinocarboxamide synthase [Syntrophorhabdaceae bacterium]HQK46989.1 phosphoribosylaminoimidazolesuccinocarboxamide synthase [Syntrophorhabdaceae bacterium]